VLLTGGVDGLACVFDVSAAADEEEALAGVLSIGSSVARLGAKRPHARIARA
jgi:hypothetical protein